MHYTCHLNLHLYFHIYEKKKIFTQHAHMAFVEIYELVFELYLKSIV